MSYKDVKFREQKSERAYQLRLTNRIPPVSIHYAGGITWYPGYFVALSGMQNVQPNNIGNSDDFGCLLDGKLYDCGENVLYAVLCEFGKFQKNILFTKWEKKCQFLIEVQMPLILSTLMTITNTFQTVTIKSCRIHFESIIQLKMLNNADVR